MQANCGLSPSMYLRNAGNWLIQGIPVGHIIPTSLRIHNFGPRAMVAIGSAQGTRKVASRKLIVTSSSGKAGWASRGENPMDKVSSGGGAALNGSKLRGKTEAKAPSEINDDAHNILPGGQNLGRRGGESHMDKVSSRAGGAALNGSKLGGLGEAKAPGEISADTHNILSGGQNLERRGGESPMDELCSLGGGAAVNGSKIRGESEAKAPAESGDDDHNILSGGQNLGRRVAMLLAGSTVLSGLRYCRVCEEAAAAEEWDYGGPCGPVTWTGTCKSGLEQSPVDIDLSNTKAGESMGVLNFVYVPSSVSVKNTGHGTIQVNFANPNNFLTVKGQTLQLLQFHFHAPSEHAFDGERYPMEAHLVHRDPISSKIVVVGVMLDASKNALPNKCLAASLAFVPQEHDLSVDAPIKVSPSFLLPPIPKDHSRGYVHYSGSLTTPPCSEGVDWFVLDTPLKINSSQVVDFMRFSGDGRSLAFNSRPLQPLANRTIFKGP